MRPEASLAAVRNDTHGAGSTSPANLLEPAQPPGPKQRLNRPDACRAAGPKPVAEELVIPLPAPAHEGTERGGRLRERRGGAGCAFPRAVWKNLPSMEACLGNAHFLRR